MRLRENFLGEDPPAPYALRQMTEYIQEKLAPAAARLGRAGWNRAIATSATASAVASAVARVPRSKRDEIDRQRVATTEVRKLYAKLSTMSLASRRKVTGIGPRRAEIIVPGLAVLLPVPDGIPAAGHVLFARRSPRRHHRRSGGPQRRGRTVARLSREQRAEVEEMCRRYGVSLAHGRKVASIAHHTVHRLAAAA